VARSRIVGEYSTVTQEQFDTLFDEAYLELYGPREDPEQTEREALGAASLAGVELGAEILDCPCGWGRHAFVLARAGYRMTGADRSQALLDEARRRGAEFELVQADYRDLPFPDAGFDAVFNLFSALGYTGEEGDARALGEFRRVLRPGGKLVIETMHRDRLMRVFQPRRWERLPTGYLLEEGAFDQVEGVYANTITYIADDGSPRALPYAIRVYTITELVKMLRAAGFEQVDCYGGLDGSELGFETRLVLVAG
jgi:ubiquinone/menaquinone biosynthesis C-methylase UbiE